MSLPICNETRVLDNFLIVAALKKSGYNGSSGRLSSTERGEKRKDGQPTKNRSFGGDTTE